MHFRLSLSAKRFLSLGEKQLEKRAKMPLILLSTPPRGVTPSSLLTFSFLILRREGLSIVFHGHPAVSLKPEPSQEKVIKGPSVRID